MEKILFSLFIIFISAKLAGEVFERLGIPVIIGELLVGVAIGTLAPSLLRPGDVFEVIAEIGVVILLFTAGLETPVNEFLKVGKTAVLVAILGVIFPFALGFALILYLGYSTAQAVFLGVAMVATSVGITARVLADLNYLQKKESQIILGAAVVDDILGLLILAVVTGLQNGDFSWLKLSILISEVSVFIFALLFFGARLTRKHGEKMDKLYIKEGPLVIALAATLGLAALAGYIGMAAIVGAFLAGVVFAEVNELYSLRQQVVPVYELFVPFFFVIIGSKVSLNQLANPRVIWLTAAVVVLAIAGKVIGCGLAAFKLGGQAGLRIGVGMVPRGEVGVIVALLGLSMQVISDGMYAVIIMMSIITTFIAPFLIKLTFKEKLT